MANTTQPFVPNFNGENYDYWSIKMKTFFCSQDLWDIVEEGFTIPCDSSTLIALQWKELKEDKKRDSKALYIYNKQWMMQFFPE